MTKSSVMVPTTVTFVSGRWAKMSLFSEFEIVFKDGTTKTGTFEETNKLWDDALDTDNPPKSCYPINTDYKAP